MLADGDAELLLNIPAGQAQYFANFTHCAHTVHRRKQIRRVAKEHGTIAGQLHNTMASLELALKIPTDVAWHGVGQIGYDPGHSSSTQQQQDRRCPSAHDATAENIRETHKRLGDRLGIQCMATKQTQGTQTHCEAGRRKCLIIRLIRRRLRRKAAHHK